MKRLIPGMLTLVLVACNAASVGSAAATASPTESATPSPTEQPTAEPLPTETPAPTNPPTVMQKVGETLTIQQGGQDTLAIVVSKASIHSTYADTTSGIGCCPDEPQVKGNVYLQVYITYNALSSGESYGSYDWQVYSGDEVVAENTAYVSNGPTPELQSGDLPKGKIAKGWIVFEVPGKGPLTLAYLPAFASNTEPIGEYLIRN